MGMHHLLSVNDDTLELNKERRSELEVAIGKAIFTLCVDPQFGYLRGPKLERVTSVDILNAGGAVRYAGEVHHTELKVIVWSGGCLTQLDKLSAEELQEVSVQVSQVVERRS